MLTTPTNQAATSPDETIRDVLADLGQLAKPLPEIGDDDDLLSLGLASHSGLNVMLGLEEAFGIEFPDALLRLTTLRSIAAIRAAIGEVREGRAG